MSRLAPRYMYIVVFHWGNLRKKMFISGSDMSRDGQSGGPKLGKASHLVRKFVFSCQLISPIMHSICIGLLQTFLWMAGNHAEFWNAEEIGKAGFRGCKAGHCFHWLFLSFFLSLFPLSTSIALGKLPRLKFCFPEGISLSKKWIIFIFLQKKLQ